MSTYWSTQFVSHYSSDESRWNFSFIRRRTFLWFTIHQVLFKTGAILVISCFVLVVSVSFHANVLLFCVHFNSFYATGLFLNPLKASENLWFSEVFRGYRKRLATWYRLRALFCLFIKCVWMTIIWNLTLPVPIPDEEKKLT